MSNNQLLEKLAANIVVVPEERSKNKNDTGEHPQLQGGDATILVGSITDDIVEDVD